MRARATFCNHYRAMANHETCKVDVAYSSFAGLPFDKQPCFRRDKNETPRGGCSLQEFPTPEEIEESEKWMAERFANVGKARLAIVEHLGGPWKRGTPGASGEIPCPVCGGKLRFSRAGYNGHIHAACSTEDCVRWME